MEKQTCLVGKTVQDNLREQRIRLYNLYRNKIRDLTIEYRKESFKIDMELNKCLRFHKF